MSAFWKKHATQEARRRPARAAIHDRRRFAEKLAGPGADLFLVDGNRQRVDEGQAVAELLARRSVTWIARKGATLIGEADVTPYMLNDFEGV